MPWILVAALLTPADLPSSMTVRLYPSRDVDPAAVVSGSAVATRILSRAGLTPIWIVCPLEAPASACADAIEPSTLIVRIQSGAPDQWPCGEAQMAPGLRGGQFATLRVHCVARVAARTRLRLATVFGHTLIHEIGHLLMGSGHAGFGIMQSEFDRLAWYRADAGKLNFTADETTALRLALANRAAASSPADAAR